MSSFWKKFDDLMDSVPDFIEEQLDKVSGGNSVEQTSTGSVSTTKVTQNGKKVIIMTTKKKTTITVDNKKVYDE